MDSATQGRRKPSPDCNLNYKFQKIYERGVAARAGVHGKAIVFKSGRTSFAPGQGCGLFQRDLLNQGIGMTVGEPPI